MRASSTPAPTLVNQRSYIEPRAFADVYRSVNTLMREDRTGELDQPIGIALGRMVSDFLVQWHLIDARRRQQIEVLPERDKRIVRRAAFKTSELLAEAWVDDLSDSQANRLFVPRVLQTAVVAGERVVAMRMAGEEDEQIRFVSETLSEMVQRAHLAGRVRQLADAQNVEPEDLAPGLAAAVLSYYHADQMSPTEALERCKLARGAALGRDVHKGTALAFGEVIQEGLDRVVMPIEMYGIMSRDAFLPREDVLYEDLTGRDRVLVDQLDKKPSRPVIDVRSLVAFASSARGGNEEARVDGALDLFQSVVSMARIRSGASGDHITRFALMGNAIDGLRKLADIVAEERSTHREAEERWKAVERDMEFVARQQKFKGGDAESVVYPFPDEFKAHEARALYLQDAISKGIPLGYVLAELYDARDLTFGESERRFFERLAFYAARKYAANFAVEDDPLVERIAQENDEVRAEEVRAVLRTVEVSLREHEQEDDAALRERAQHGLEQAQARGELTGQQVRALDDSIDRMITRVRAGQEVRFLTALYAIEGRVPDDLIPALTQLPHVERLAHANLQETRLLGMQARNGQRMRELERSTRARWMRYRQQAPAGQDVAPVRVAGGQTDEDEVENPLRVKSRPAFRKSMPQQQRVPNEDTRRSGSKKASKSTVKKREKRPQRIGRGGR